MLVTKSKLDEFGGYESMDFSLVEDVALLARLVENGNGVALNYNELTHIHTTGESNWKMLMIQRRRWMQGFKSTPTWLQLVLLIKFSFLPSLVYLTFQNPIFILGFVIKSGLSLLFIKEVERSVKSSNSVFVVLLFELFEPILYYSTLICSAFPDKIKWRGREY